MDKRNPQRMSVNNNNKKCPKKIYNICRKMKKHCTYDIITCYKMKLSKNKKEVLEIRKMIEIQKFIRLVGRSV